MLYMAKGNKIIFWIIIHLLFILYLLFRIFEWSQLEDGNRAIIASKHSDNILLNDNINCLILGGSNAFFSLSAEQINNKINLECYNLSLLNEGYSDSSYWDYIENLQINRNKIFHIIYSSVSPIATQQRLLKRIENNQKSIGINGDQSFSLLGRSIASYFKDLMEKGSVSFIQKSYPIPNRFGDFNFKEYKHCNNYHDIIPGFKMVDNLSLVQDWGNSQIKEIKSLFPSTLQSKKYKNKKYKAIIKTLENITIKQSKLSQSVTLIVQSPFEQKSDLCDGEHHGNENGRRFRTNDLIKSLKNFIKY